MDSFFSKNWRFICKTGWFSSSPPGVYGSGVIWAEVLEFESKMRSALFVELVPNLGAGTPRQLFWRRAFEFADGVTSVFGSYAHVRVVLPGGGFASELVLLRDRCEELLEALSG